MCIFFFPSTFALSMFSAFLKNHLWARRSHTNKDHKSIQYSINLEF